MTASLERQGLGNSHLNRDRAGVQGDPQVSRKFKISLGFYKRTYFKTKMKVKGQWGATCWWLLRRPRQENAKFKASLNEWCFQGMPDRVLKKIEKKKQSLRPWVLSWVTQNKMKATAEHTSNTGKGACSQFPQWRPLEIYNKQSFLCEIQISSCFPGPTSPICGCQLKIPMKQVLLLPWPSLTGALYTSWSQYFPYHRNLTVYLYISFLRLQTKDRNFKSAPLPSTHG